MKNAATNHRSIHNQLETYRRHRCEANVNYSGSNRLVLLSFKCDGSFPRLSSSSSLILISAFLLLTASLPLPFPLSPPLRSRSHFLFLLSHSLQPTSSLPAFLPHFRLLSPPLIVFLFLFLSYHAPDKTGKKNPKRMGTNERLLRRTDRSQRPEAPLHSCSAAACCVQRPDNAKTSVTRDESSERQIL